MTGEDFVPPSDAEVVEEFTPPSDAVAVSDEPSKKKAVSQPIIEPVNKFSKDILPSGATSASAAQSTSAKTPFEQKPTYFVPEKLIVEGVPKEEKLAREYEISQNNLVGAQKGVDWATRRDEELKGSLDPEARKSAGKYTQDAAIKLGQAQFKADENIAKLKEAIKGDLDYLGSNLENFTRKSQEDDVIADEVKIDEYAREQARKKGLPEDGYYKNFLYNNAKAEVAQKIIEPDVLKEREKLFKEKTGKSIEDAFGEDFTKGFTKAQEIEATAKTQINSVAQEVNALAKTETEEIAKGVNSQIEQLNAAYQQQAAQVTDQSQADALYQEYTANFNRLQANFLDAQNQINGKYNQRLRRQADEIEKVANQKWSEEAEKYKKDYKVSPDLLEQLKTVSQEAYKKVVGSKEKVKEVRDLYTPAISNYYRSTVSSLGRSLGNLSETMGYDYGKVLGDYMENTYQVGSAELNSWKDLLDASKLAKSAGQLTGAMLPSMGAAAATTIATQGLGAPEAISMLSGGLAAWAGESMDMAGNIERQTFAETGDANKALQRSKRMWDAQMAIMPLYSLEMLPFMKGFGLSKNMVKRMAGGAGVEFATEVGQEYIQNRAEATINADKEFSEIFKDASWKEFGHTALNVAPVMILGAGGQIRGEKSEQEKINDEAKSFALKTKFSEIAPDQLNQFMADMVSQKGATFTSAYISNLYTNGKIDKAQANDLVKSMGVAAEVQQKAKEYGFDETQQKVFTAFKFKLQNAQQQAANETDPILKQAAEAKVKELEEQTVNFASGKQADYIVMTYPNGEQYVLSVGQGQSAAKNPKIQQAVADGAIKLEGSGKGVDVVNLIGENIKQSKKQKNDKENQAGLPSEVGERQEPVKAEPIEEGRGTEIAPSGILQAQEEKVGSVDVEFTAKGGNKVVGEKGEPITLLHGTNNDKINFDEGTVFYATNDKKFADVYGENLFPVKISLKNPYDLTDSVDGIIKDKNGEPMLDEKGVPYSINYIDQSVVKDLKSRGFDGVRIGNESVVAFDKSQVKAAEQPLKEQPKEEPTITPKAEEVAGSKSDAMQQENTGNNAAPAQKLKTVPSLSDKAKQKFKDAGFKVSNGSLSKTDFGVSSYFYIERPDGTQQKVRVSDHSVENKGRMDNEVFINMDSQDIDGAIREATERIDGYTKNKEIRDKFLDEEAEKNKGRAAKASAKWEAIKRDFEGQKFAVNERTYQSLEEFKKKVPDAKNIIQTPLDKGAFKYEYSVDKKSEIKGNEKPSQEYIENYEKETTTQDTQIESNQQQPSKGKAKGAVRATEKPVPVTDKEAKKQAREAKKQQEEELKKRKKDLANAEPNDIKQLILQYFYGGGRILTEDFKNETGFGTRGGQQDKVRAFKEFKKRIWAHSGKSPSMDDLVMQFQDEWKANYGSAEDQQAIRNEIIGVLKDFDSKSQIERELERLFSVGGKIVTSRDERNQSQQEEDLMQRYAPESAEEAAQMEAWEAMNRSQQDFVMEDDYTAYLLGRVDEMTEEEAQEYLDNEEKYNQLIKQENENYERESKTNAKDSSATTGQAKAAKEYEAELAELNKKLKDAEKAKRDKLDRISGKVDLFADEAKANELFGAEQNLSAENIAKQLKPETDKIAKLEAEKAAFEANKENYLKKYDNQSEISEAAPEKVLTEKEKAAKELADRIRKKKWGGANVVFDFGLTKTIYNFAVDKVADAVESGTELGKAIQQAVEWIESQMNGKEWDKKGFSDSFSDEGNDGKVPPTEKEGEPESAEGKTKKHILGLRVENSELIPEEIRKGLLEKGIEYIQKGVKVSQKEAQQIVDAYEKQGDLDGLADYVMNPLNRIEGDVKVALEQELYKKYAEKAGKATSEEEKAEYRKRTIDILYAAQKTGAEAGRAVNMQKAWQDIAGRDPQGIVAAYKREIEERNEPFLAKHEPSIKSAFEQLQDLLETEEGQQLIKEQIEKEVEAQVEAITEPLTTERRKKADKAIAAIKGFRNKIKANSYSDAVGIVAAVDTALGIIEKAIDKGASVADAIERGVRYVNKKMNGKGWNEAQFRKDVEQGFKDAGIEITEKEKKVSKIKDAATRLKGKSKDLDALIKDPAKALEELENKKVAAEKRAKERESKSEEVKALEVEIKLKKKLVRLIQSFAALTDKQKKDIISETLDFIIKNGYLSEAEFRNIFAKSIGLDHLTAQDEARILELSEIISKVKDAADKLSENPTPENVENFKKAFWEARKANEKLSGYFREKKSFLEFWSTAIRGSLLTPATGVLSFATNLVQTPIMLSEYATSTALDYIRYNLAKIDLLNKKFPNLFDKKQSISAGAFYSNYLPSMWSGLKEGAKQMWTGSMPESISDREMKGSLHPSDNFMKVWNSLSGKEKQSFVDNLQDSAEFLLGVPAETMFRILNLTDKPFRRGIEGGVLSELIELDLAQKKKQIEAKPVKSEADLVMLDEINSGREKTRLLTNPPEELMAKAEQEGLEGVFQDKHMITKLLEAASQRFKSEMKSRKGEKNRFQTYLKGLASVFKTTQFPYINMPANFLSLIIKYSNPVIPAMSAMFKLNKGDVRGAQKEMAAVVTSLIIGKVAEFLIVNGLATGAGDDDDEKKRSMKREGQPANTFNLSAFARLRSGGNPNYQAGDYCVRYNQLGVAGVVVNTYANVYEMKGKKAFEQLDWTEKYINLTFSGGRTGLDQSMVSGTSALIDAFSSTNEYKFNRWATQTVKAIMSPIIPNTATKVIAATDRDNLLKNTREDDLVTWVKNNMKAQLGLDNDLPNFITIWGEKAKKTPTDRNAWVYQLFDFTKGAPTNQDYVASEIYKLWKSQYDIDKEYGTNLANSIIPEVIPKKIKLNGIEQKLTPSQHEELSILVGKNRKVLVSNYINGNIITYNDKGQPVNINWDEELNEKKADRLNKIYENGYKQGLAEFKAKYGYK